MFGTLCLTVPTVQAAPAPTQSSALDLVGHWEADVEFGKAKFHLKVDIAKSAPGRVEAKIDIPEQGARQIPVNAVLYNHPAVRWEIDAFNTAFNGQVNEAANEIKGRFEEGPGGRPISLTFRRVEAPQAEPERVFTFTAGEAPDIRGYWEGQVDDQPGSPGRLGLKIGRAADGSFAAALDIFEHAANGLPASTAAYTNSTARLEWKFAEATFDGKLNDAGDQLAGQWRQRGKPMPVTFRRLAQPATVMPANVSFTAQADVPTDIRGYWNGALTIQGNKLRIVIKIGQTPEGAFAGSLASPDQGSSEVPITSISYTNPVVRLESKGIRGVYTGKLNPAGTMLDGTWEQSGAQFELKLARSAASTAAKKP
ncbi:MAG: hypothetical protein U1G07_25875 [Verrucomicrobiota bacterium]